MTDNSAPGIYTQPDGDADDVLGHRQAFDKKADAQPEFAARLHDDDVEGHIKARDAAPDSHRAQDDADDVEGHLKVRDAAPDSHRAQDDADDVEGHRFQDRVQDRVQLTDDADDVEGHRR